MKDSNHPLCKIKSKLKALVPLLAIKELSRSSGFMVRTARKITALDFVLSFFMCCAGRKASLSNWVSQLCILNGPHPKQEKPSRQAICKRLTEASSTFAEALLARLLSSRINTIIQKLTSTKKKGGVLRFFPKVLIQDSTTICLPDALSCLFKGNFSKGVIKAVARIQCIMDIRTMRFAHFQLGSFCDNDQGASSLVHHLVSKGTLVIRDLGYFALNSLKQISARKGYFLSRLRYGLRLYSPDGKELELTSILKSSVSARSIDIIVGKECRLPARLVIIPLSPQVASERRRKARADRDRRLNHSKEYMQALGYQILLTNVGEDLWTPEQASEVYRLRWGIECIFKGFKSAGLHLNELCRQIKINAERARSTLLLALCFIVVQVIIIYQLFRKTAGTEVKTRLTKGKKSADDPTAKGLYLSMNRILDWICDNFILWLISPPQAQRNYLLMCCCYEHRKDRINMAQHLKLAF